MALAREYEQKLNDMKETQKRQARELQRRELELENQSFQHRQKMLLEVEAMRQRQTDIKRSASLDEKTNEVEQERLHTLEQALRDREAAFAKERSDFFAKMQAEMSTYKVNDCPLLILFASILPCLILSDATNVFAGGHTKRICNAGGTDGRGRGKS